MRQPSKLGPKSSAMGLAEVVIFFLSAGAIEADIHGAETKRKQSRSRRPKVPCIGVIFTFLF